MSIPAAARREIPDLPVPQDRRGIRDPKALKDLPDLPGPQDPAGADSTVPGPQGPPGATGPAGTTDWAGITGKPSTFAPDVEVTQDIVGSLLVAGTNITLNYDDVGNALTINSSGGGAPGGATIADTPPGSPTAGQFWWESDTGGLFLYYNDGSSSQWTQVNGATSANKQTISTSAPSGGDDGDVWYQVP